MQKQAYLGDWVYVEFDGYEFILRANDFYNLSDTIYLEPEVLEALKKYTRRIEAEVRLIRDAQIEKKVWTQK